jgi:hypothetical protein
MSALDESLNVRMMTGVRKLASEKKSIRMFFFGFEIKTADVSLSNESKSVPYLEKNDHVFRDSL